MLSLYNQIREENGWEIVKNEKKYVRRKIKIIFVNNIDEHGVWQEVLINELTCDNFPTLLSLLSHSSSIIHRNFHKFCIQQIFEVRRRLINCKLLSHFRKSTNSRWRATVWFQMPTSTSGGNALWEPGSISQLAKFAVVKIVSRRPKQLSHDQPQSSFQSWDAHRSAITQSNVWDVDSHWLRSRWEIEWKLCLMSWELIFLIYL